MSFPRATCYSTDTVAIPTLGGIDRLNNKTKKTYDRVGRLQLIGADHIYSATRCSAMKISRLLRRENTLHMQSKHTNTAYAAFTVLGSNRTVASLYINKSIAKVVVGRLLQLIVGIYNIHNISCTIRETYIIESNTLIYRSERHMFVDKECRQTFGFIAKPGGERPHEWMKVIIKPYGCAAVCWGTTVRTTHKPPSPHTNNTHWVCFEIECATQSTNSFGLNYLQLWISFV